MNQWCFLFLQKFRLTILRPDLKTEDCWKTSIEHFWGSLSWYSGRMLATGHHDKFCPKSFWTKWWSGKKWGSAISLKTGWWFETFFIFIPIWGNDPNWLAHIFEVGGSTTNWKRFRFQKYFWFHFHLLVGFFEGWTPRFYEATIRCTPSMTEVCLNSHSRLRGRRLRNMWRGAVWGWWWWWLSFFFFCCCCCCCCYSPTSILKSWNCIHL